MTTPSPAKSSSLLHLVRTLWEVLAEDIVRQKKTLIMAILFALLSIGATLTAPYILQQIIDNVLPQKDTALLLIYTILLVLAYLTGVLLWAVQIRYSVQASEQIFFSLRNRLVGSILHKPLAFFHRYLSGDLLTRLTNDLEFLSEFFYQNLFRALSFFLFSLVTIVVLLLWNWKLGLISLATLPLFVFYTNKIHRPISDRAKVAKKNLSAQNDILLDLLRGIQELRFYQQEGLGRRRFDDASRRYTDSLIRSVTFTDWMRIVIDFIGIMVTLIPFVAGGLMITMGDPLITIGLLIAYFQLLTILTSQIQFIFEAVTRLAQLFPALQRLKEIMDYPETPPVKILDIQHTPDSSRIEFRNLCFSYPSGREVLKDFSLTIEPGEKVAIMGPSGSGKTTIAHLLIRFLEPTRGEIYFGGRQIVEYPYPLYLTYFSYVGQQSHLFRQTIAENIAMGWYHVPFDRIAEAAAVVRMNDPIDRLPQKYDTVVGEKGTDFSGGQRQRFALARALIRDPEIFVLDEFTSALDKAVEKEILDDLFRIFKKQTIICITHSPEVSAHFERKIDLG